MSLTLITGGARSGKSHFAQELALRAGGKVLFVATATASDSEMAERIKKHKADRPAGWETLEAIQDVARSIEQKNGGFQVFLIDCVTLLINNIFTRYLNANGELTDEVSAEQSCNREIGSLLDFIKRVDANFIIVTNEVGEGIVPANKLSRVYRDVLGKINQKIGKEADTVYLMVAGIPLKIKPMC